MIVVAIVAILAAIGSPSFEALITGARVSAAGSALRGALELARSEAVTRGTRAGVCRSADSNAAMPACSDDAALGFGANDWAAGWFIYAKAEGNAGDGFETGDVVVRRQPALAPGGQARAMLWAPAAGPIVYGWNGIRVAGPVGAFAIDHGNPVAARPATFYSNQARCMQLNVVGRIDEARAVAGACP